MNKGFYTRLAANNIRKNSKTYLPYILTCIGTMCMFYLICSLYQNPQLTSIVGGRTAQTLLMLGTWVTGIFSVIFLFYTNSFLMKRRKKEFGLYSILGMDKRHISRVILCETLFILIFSLVIGLGLGMLLDKAMFLSLVSLLGGGVSLGFNISVDAILLTCGTFTTTFILIFINAFMQIHLSNPIELLHGGRVGEREPKTKLLMTTAGVVCLGSGYLMSIYTLDPISTLIIFFYAVILVILGTYFLFTAGSVALLKLLRKNKNYYYKTNHFISVSGMIYRMKQNAVGLSNICILSTAVLVMLSSTLTLQIGREEVIQSQYPRNMTVTYGYDSISQLQQLFPSQLDVINNTVEKHNMQPVNPTIFSFYLVYTSGEGGKLDPVTSNMDATNQQALFFIPLEDYNWCSGDNLTLENGQALVYSTKNPFSADTLEIMGQSFEIKQRLTTFLDSLPLSNREIDSYFFVVKDISVLEALRPLTIEIDIENPASLSTYYGFDLDGSQEKNIEFYNDLLDTVSYEHLTSITSRDDIRRDVVSTYSGLFFIGIFLGVLFMMATILIIYYKQISEGYDDKSRFEIMQKVGMSHREIKKSISSQVLTVFFLPLLTAGVHIAFASPPIFRILKMLHINNLSLFVACTLGFFAVFAVFYAALYWLTSRVYYKIVS